jgi:hypothetical protein
VNAAIMPRGELEPMWLATVGISLPVWFWLKQARAVDENESRQTAQAQAEEAIRQVVRLRAGERHTFLDATLKTLELYREGILVQSDVAVRSTLAQYKVGKATFASVLDVMRGLLVDQGGYLETLAQAQRLAIAQREVSLEAPAGGGVGGVASGAIPSAGASGAGGRPAARGGGAAPASGGAGGAGGAGGGAAMPGSM